MFKVHKKKKLDTNYIDSSLDFISVIMGTRLSNYVSVLLIDSYIFTIYIHSLQSWFLSNAPGPLFMILGAYLYFCLYAGPRYMRDRKPFDLKNTLLVYNAVQVLLSWVLFYEGYKGGWGGHYNFKCQPVTYATDPISMRVS